MVTPVGIRVKISPGHVVQELWYVLTQLLRLYSPGRPCLSRPTVSPGHVAQDLQYCTDPVAQALQYSPGPVPQYLGPGPVAQDL